MDSILIDEARTPLIIQRPGRRPDRRTARSTSVAPLLKSRSANSIRRTGEGVIEPGDFTVDEKSHQIPDRGRARNVERLLAQAGLLPEGASLYDPANIT